ncbi:hypothetical protein DPMN_050379 [Dreissena polymorpha]|uniref:Uncharacterized protein n=1 Tax=Dreissena polymorpha TaxID=45954 RepID=A0A9D4CH25_DREPO|nr:hypothetical protein DPMN_050379 [Dreissena polymorpha]
MIICGRSQNPFLPSCCADDHALENVFRKLPSQYPGAVAAEFENATIASLLQENYYQCCSPVGGQKYCHLYQQINPPDYCSRYTISSEIRLEDKKDTPQIEDVSVDVEKSATNPRSRVVRNVKVMETIRFEY